MPAIDHMTTDEKHAGLLIAFSDAKDTEEIQQLIMWASFQDFNPDQEEEQTGAYYEAVERIRTATKHDIILF